MNIPILVGCDDLREWLIKKGFRVAHDSLAHDSRNDGNECNWYACRRSGLSARECECNEGKPIQLVVRPYKFVRHICAWESVEVDVTGEAGGAWFKLQAYGLKQDELRERLGDIEGSLIAAWNALLPNVTFSRTRPQYTPGPWRAFETEDGCSRVVPNAGGLLVAQCETRSPYDPEQMANARLIAAAPELLEALDNLVSACELPGDHCEVAQALPAAIAALAKAFGGTPSAALSGPHEESK